MSSDPNLYFAIGGFSLAAVIFVSLVSLRGWREWLALKHAELDQRAEKDAPAAPSATSRIEVADLKERVKKLEAIAAGIDL